MTDLKPHEIDREDYRAHVETLVDVAEDLLIETCDIEDLDPTNINNQAETVRYAIQGDRWIDYYGYPHAVIFWSGVDPSNPEWGYPWHESGTAHDGDHRDALQAMAWTCIYDDVMREVRDRLDDGGDGDD